MVRQERNWGLILGIVSALVIYPVAMFAGVSDETAVLRALIGAIVGAFIGYGFNYMGAAGPAKNVKGTTLDVVLSEIEERALEQDLKAPSCDFQPLDLTQAARVVERMKD